MGKTTLVNKDIEEGQRLVDMLVESGEVVPLALWMYSSSRGDWRLVLAIPQMARSPQEGYNFIRNVLKDLHPPVNLSLQDITLISPDNSLVKSIIKDKTSARALKHRILPSLKIGDAFLEGAYLYKVA